MRRAPPVGSDTQPIIRMVDDLPAPLGPRKPNTSPRSTSKSMPSTAVNSPNCLVRPHAAIRDTQRDYGGEGLGQQFWRKCSCTSGNLTQLAPLGHDGAMSCEHLVARSINEL